MKKAIDAIYDYLYDVEDPDECRKRLDNILDFVVRLHHSFVDNDKPLSSVDVNMNILRIAEEQGLRIAHVKVGKP